jgi:hypothetical protein
VGVVNGRRKQVTWPVVPGSLDFWGRISSSEPNAASPERCRMSWLLDQLLEQPLAIIFVGVVTLAVLFGGLVKTGKKWFLYVIAAAALLFGGLLAVEHWVVTPREEVENTIYRIARELEANNLGAVQSHLKPGTKPSQDAEHYMNRLHVKQAKVKSNLKVEVHTGQSPLTATATFNAVVIGGDRRGEFQNQRFPRFFVVEFVREDDGWLVYDYEMHEPQRGL